MQTRKCQWCHREYDKRDIRPHEKRCNANPRNQHHGTSKYREKQAMKFID